MIVDTIILPFTKCSHHQGTFRACGRVSNRNLTKAKWQRCRLKGFRHSYADKKLNLYYSKRNIKKVNKIP